ncbi:hypothetical protein K474DRAFT_1657513, partial [Panus rudis PR-1116 ss-1]
MKIQDMDDFFENIPRMPLVLVTHDVYHEDWIRFMTVSLPNFSVYSQLLMVIIGSISVLGWEASCPRIRSRWPSTSQDHPHRRFD